MARTSSTARALVLYEYPFNEGIRTMLRLEHLFDRLGQLEDALREKPLHRRALKQEGNDR